MHLQKNKADNMPTNPQTQPSCVTSQNIVQNKIPQNKGRNIRSAFVRDRTQTRYMSD
jgi:hypothetical protein